MKLNNCFRTNYMNFDYYTKKLYKRNIFNLRFTHTNIHESIFSQNWAMRYSTDGAFTQVYELFFGSYYDFIPNPYREL